MTKKSKYCQHRTTIEYHPNCFREPMWYDSLSVGYLDIEASGLEANQAWMLSWAIKRRGDYKVVSDNVTWEDIHPRPGKVNFQYDKDITKSLLEEMQYYDVLVGYYSTGFDIPFIRTRAMYYGLKFPRFGEIKHIDLFYHVRSKMCLNRNSLDMATKHLDIAGKTKLDFKYWRLASMGDRDAMRELIEHNNQDVLILEKLHEEIEPYCKFTKKSV